MARSRSNTRIGEEIKNTAAPRQVKGVEAVCNILDKIIDKKFVGISQAASTKDPELLLDKITDFRSLVYLRNGMCKK